MPGKTLLLWTLTVIPSNNEARVYFARFFNPFSKTGLSSAETKSGLVMRNMGNDDGVMLWSISIIPGLIS